MSSLSLQFIQLSDHFGYTSRRLHQLAAQGFSPFSLKKAVMGRRDNS